MSIIIVTNALIIATTQYIYIQVGGQCYVLAHTYVRYIQVYKGRLYIELHILHYTLILTQQTEVQAVYR